MAEVAVFCRKCGVSLPEGSQFCPKCGQSVQASAPPAATLYCRGCGKTLPDGSSFCVDCGRPVASALPDPALGMPPTLKSCVKCGARFPVRAHFCPMCGHLVNAKLESPPPPIMPVPARSKWGAYQLIVWIVLVAVALGVWWVLASDNQYAEQVRSLANRSHAETIVPSVFSVKPGGFSSYQFNVPFGSVAVDVNGEFTATGNNNSQVEVFVFKDQSFVNWQYGYAPSAYYSSGKAIKGDIEAALPSGPGTYYVVFNNNFSPHTTKSVQANVTLHYEKFW